MSLDGTSIDIDSDNRAFVTLSIRRLPDNNPTKIKFKYDPGADASTISKEDLETIGYTDDIVKSLIKPDGAGTTADGTYYEWFSIQLNVNHILKQVVPKDLRLSFKCVTRKIVPKPRLGCPGCELVGEIYGAFRSSLLGNDILSAFDVVIDREKREMRFKRTADLSQRNKQYPNCQLLELTREPSNPLSQDAKILLGIIRESGFIKRVSDGNRLSYNLNVNDIDTAIQELLSHNLVTKDKFDESYRPS